MHDIDVRTCRFISSPHFNARPAGTDVDLIVLHAISLPSGEFDSRSVKDLFTGELDVMAHPGFASLEGVRVSAHFLVDRCGTFIQFVPVSKRAWHAGKSSWDGRGDCNDYSIGIEMIGDENQPFTRNQYRETARLCRVLMDKLPSISMDRIVGHSNIAPDRKWDPGRQWDWDHFQRSLSRIRKLDLDFR